MIKKILLSVFLAAVAAVFSIIGFNNFANTPQKIYSHIAGDVQKTNPLKFESYHDWLWEADRAFVFDIYYMNLIHLGTVRMHLAGETVFKNDEAILLEANLELSQMFKQMYDARMVINSAVLKSTKESLWYQEQTITPEKEKSKEIVFNPQEGIAIREGKKYKIPSLTYDPFSAFFAFLGSEYNLNEKLLFQLLSKEEIYGLAVTPEQLNNNIYTLSGEVARVDRSSAHGASFKMWVYSDTVRLPLLIKASTGAGAVYLRLRSVE